MLIMNQTLKQANAIFDLKPKKNKKTSLSPNIINLQFIYVNYELNNQARNIKNLLVVCTDLSLQ